MSVRATVHKPGHATGTAESHAGESYTFLAVETSPGFVRVTLWGRLRGGHERKMPRTTLMPLRAEIARVCRHAAGWQP